MKIPSYLLQAFRIGLLLFLSTSPLQAASPTSNSRVLIIHSYHAGLSWTDAVMNGIRDAFAQSGDEILFSAEYLDARRFPDPGLARQIRELVVAKLEGTIPDLIVVSDNAALDFVLAERNRLFPEIPIVFCGINGFTPSMIANHRRITGVAEDVSVVETVALTLRLHPKTKEIIVIGRTSVAADRVNRDSFAAALPGLPAPLKVSFWDDLPLSELQTRLARLDGDSVVFLNGLLTDETGRQLMYGEATTWICRHSPVPVYSLWDVYLGYGIVGGKLVSGYRQGQLAGELARSILSGEKVDRLPVVNAREANRFMFDYRQLERLAIPLSALPGDALFIHRPDSFYHQHKIFVWTIAAVLVVLSSLVVFLAMAVVRRRRAEEALRQANLVVENSPVVLFRWKAAENWPVILVSRNVIQFGYTAEEFLSGAVPYSSIVYPEDLERVASEVQQHAAAGADQFQQQYRIITRGGEVRWVDDHTTIERLDDGQIVSYQGTIMDITERKHAEAALQESERKFRDLTEKAIAGVYLIQDGVFKYVNARFAEMHGCRVAEMIDKMAATEAIVPEDRPMVVEHVRKRLEGEVPLLTFRIVTKNGELRHVEDYSVSTLYRERPAMIGTVVDITERKRAEAALRASEERFRTLIESSPLPIGIGRDGKFIYVNSAYCRMMRVDSAEQMIHGSILETVAPEMREEVRGYMTARARKEEAPVSYESVGIRTDGTRFPYEIHVAEVNLSDGPALVAYINDITARKRTEEALEKRLVALTQPLDAVEGIAFEDLFNLSEIQRLQDLFAEAWGVGALITRPDGAPITQPSNFTYFCGEFIRKSEKGFNKCQISDAMLGRHNPSGPIIQKCMSAGLWGAGASITVGGCHIGNWLIGQVRNEAQSEGEIIAYARELGIDETEFLEAFLKVPTMPQEKFEQIAHTLFVLANQLSTIAYQNIQQARFINERKRAEEALQRLSKMQSVILENSPVGIAFVRNRLFEWVNPRMTEVFDITHERARGASTRIIYPSDEAYQRVGREAYPLLSQGGKAVFELELCKGDGSLFWCRLEGKALDAANLEEGVIWVYEDITERKQERESLLRTQFAMDRARDSILWVDSEGCIVYANDSACTSMGYDRDELLAMTVFDIDLDFPRSQWDQHKREMQRQGTMLFEGRHISKDGRVFPVEVSSSYFEFDGRWLACAFDRDITQRKRAEEEMRRLRNYLSNIINSMPSVLVGVDPDGCVTHWNAAAEQATGVGAEQAQGQPLDQVLPMLRRRLARLQEAMRTRKVETEAKVPRIVDGEMRYEDVTVYPLMSNGVEGAVIRVDDVTERVRIEEMMVQSEKMLSVGGLAAGMAHEINNPLGVILQAAQNVLRRVSLELPTNSRVAEECGTSLSGVRQYLERREILTFLEDIRQSGQRAADIVANMLSFSRKAEGGGTPTDLAQLLDRTISLAATDYDLKKHHDFRQIEIVRDYQPGVPRVICQAGKIQQVFLNVLRNGAEAMMATEELRRAPLFILRVGQAEGMVRVEIEDNGPGMDEAIRRRVFEPFFTTKPPGSGTGLGLSVSYFIVAEDHGGNMSVESKAGAGTRFIIELPVAGRGP